jgi:hypothetical protein
MKRCFLFILLCCPLRMALANSPLVERAERAYAAGRREEARDTLLRAAATAEEAAERERILGRVGEINLSLLLSRLPQAEADRVEVQPGDTLGKIAARENTTVELLKQINGIPGNTVRRGDRLKVPRQPFSLRVNRAENRLVVSLGGTFFKQYPVSTGAGGNTPAGEFRITDRLLHPTWWHPDDGREIPYGDPEHRIGSHWLGWDRRGFGIHGTDEPEKIGQPVSLGCVRMRNEDVAELFMLIPSGTPVVVE